MISDFFLAPENFHDKLQENIHLIEKINNKMRSLLVEPFHINTAYKLIIKSIYICILDIKRDELIDNGSD